jgi:hypothetical protein
VVIGVIGRHAEGFLGNPIVYWRSEKLKFVELGLTGAHELKNNLIPRKENARKSMPA